MKEFTLYSLNWADYFIIAVIFLSTLISLMRGFISEAVSLLTWVIAVVVAFRSAGPVSSLFNGLVHNPSMRLIVSFVLVLIIILIIGSLINHFLTLFVQSTGLSGTNLLLGMIFGFARGILLVGIFILFARMTSVAKEPWWHSSVLIPHFMGIANWLHQFIPDHLNHFSQLNNPKG